MIGGIRIERRLRRLQSLRMSRLGHLQSNRSVNSCVMQEEPAYVVQTIAFVVVKIGKSEVSFQHPC
jgi:hypothetical protein